jgi:signal peptidase I
VRILLKVINGVVTGVLILVIGGSTFLAFSARKSGDAIPNVLGHKVLNVVSGSMEPTIHTGDVIIVKPLADPAKELEDGDIITFRSREKADMLITHRIIGTVMVNGQVAGYGTQGDANEAPDLALVEPQQVVGRYRWRVPYFGYVSNFMRQPAGVIAIVILPGLILIGMEFRKIWQMLSEEEKAKAAAARAEVEGGGTDAE